MTVFDEGRVDAVIGAAREVLGSGGGPQDWPGATGVAVPAAPAGWDGTTGQVVGDTAGALREQHGAYGRLRDAAAGAVAEAATISRDAHRALDAVEASWAQDKSVLGEGGSSVVGDGPLLLAGIARVDEARQIVADAVARFGEAAQRLRRVIAG